MSAKDLLLIYITAMDLLLIYITAKDLLSWHTIHYIGLLVMIA